MGHDSTSSPEYKGNAVRAVGGSGEQVEQVSEGLANTVAELERRIKRLVADRLRGILKELGAQADAVISVEPGAGHLKIWIRGDQEFVGYFMSPSTNTHLTPGTYQAQKYPYSDATTGGLAWVTGQASQCTTVRGSFTIDSVSYRDTTLTQIDARFDEYCENLTPGLHGRIHWAAADTTRPPGPVLPVPLPLWAPPSGATPATRNYVYLTSDPGDYIGGGQTYMYSDSIGVTGTHNGLSVTRGSWLGEFQVMSSIAKPQVGYYAGLMRYPYNNPAKGEFGWDGNGHACPNVVAWVAIDRIGYDANGITTLDMRFEQHCSGAAPALHGAIRWVR